MHARRLALPTLALLTLSVSACGSGDSADDGSTAAGGTGSAGATSTPSAAGASTHAQGHGGSGHSSGMSGMSGMSHTAAPPVATSGPKPSQQEVTAGLQRYYQGIAKESGAPEHAYDAMTTCLVERLYPTITVQTANALKAGSLTRVSREDGPDVARTTSDCGSASASAQVETGAGS